MAGHIVVEGIARERIFTAIVDGEPTDRTCFGYYWDEATQQPVLFQGTATLAPVENLAVDPDYPTDHEVLVTWDNPTPTSVLNTPNETWVRVPEISPIWSTLDYPITEWDHHALQPETPYSVQVMLARRIGLELQVSPVRVVHFTTTADTVEPLPAAPDPGDSTITIVEIPAIDVGCTYEWVLYEAQPEIGWVAVDSGSESSIPLELSFPSLTPGSVYKLCYQELCPGPVLGPEICNMPWVEPTDWDDPCVPEDAGITFLSALDPLPFFVLHQTCAPAQMELWPSQETVFPGPNYGGIMDGPYGEGSYSILTAATLDNDLVESCLMEDDFPGDGEEWTLARWVYLDTELTADIGDCIVLSVNHRQMIGVRRTGSNTYPVGIVVDPLGGVHEIEGDTAMTLDTWSLITLVHHPDDGLVLYLNEAEVGALAAW